MAEFARLTPEQKATARENFRKAYEVPAEQRQATVQKFQELPEDKRRELAEPRRDQGGGAAPPDAATPEVKPAQPPAQDGTAEAVRTVAGAAALDSRPCLSRKTLRRTAPVGLPLRLAAMTYEGVLLFGVTFAVAFALLSVLGWTYPLSPSRRVILQGAFFVAIGVYFVWCWTRSGQTLALKTWKLRVAGPRRRPGVDPTRDRALSAVVAPVRTGPDRHRPRSARSAPRASRRWP